MLAEVLLKSPMHKYLTMCFLEVGGEVCAHVKTDISQPLCTFYLL